MWLFGKNTLIFLILCFIMGCALERYESEIPLFDRFSFLVHESLLEKLERLETKADEIEARMDKMPPYLISTEQGDLGIAIYETDSPMTRKVKEFIGIRLCFVVFPLTHSLDSDMEFISQLLLRHMLCGSSSPDLIAIDHTHPSSSSQ